MKIAVISTALGAPWGGSEELWSDRADVALAHGHGIVSAIYQWSIVVPKLSIYQFREKNQKKTSLT